MYIQSMVILQRTRSLFLYQSCVVIANEVKQPDLYFQLSILKFQLLIGGNFAVTDFRPSFLVRLSLPIRGLNWILPYNSCRFPGRFYFTTTKPTLIRNREAVKLV